MPMTEDGYQPIVDGPPPPVGVERRELESGGLIEIMSLDKAIIHLANAGREDREQCRRTLLAGYAIITPDYEYQLHEPGDPPMRPDRRDY